MRVLTGAGYWQLGAGQRPLQSNGSLDRRTACLRYIQQQIALPLTPTAQPKPIQTKDLPAGTQIFYKVGWPLEEEWSDVYNFTTFRDTNNFPFRVGVMADLGLSFNTTDTVSHVGAEKPNVVLNIGDLPYADNFLPNGKEGTIKKYKYFLSYQPRWDMYGRMLQPLSTWVPVMTSTGGLLCWGDGGGRVWPRCRRTCQP